MRKKNKNKTTTPQKWEILGFTDKHHYQGWLHFNSLVDETYTYDDTWYDEYTGTVVSISEDEYPDSEKADEEYVRVLLSTIPTIPESGAN